MDKQVLLLSFRRMIKEVHTWLGTPEFRHKLISNIADIYRMSMSNSQEMTELGQAAFDHLNTIRPKSVPELKNYMRLHEISKVTDRTRN